MNTPAKSATHPWFEAFRANPSATLDALLRGQSRVSPYERATPSEILKRMFGPLADGDEDLQLLDRTLCSWFVERVNSGTPGYREQYGKPRFVTEFIDGLSVTWLLPLPVTRAWIQDNYIELSQWAASLRLSEVWDLPRELATAAALTQLDARMRFVWLRLCADSAVPSKRSLIGPALTGLGLVPDLAGNGASKELVGGLARFGAALTPSAENQIDFVRQWRALKVRFPRVPTTWRKLWHEVLSNRRYENKAFCNWLLEADPPLARPLGQRTASILPTAQQLQNVLSLIRSDGREDALIDATDLLNRYEKYAESTGDSDYFVRSACNIANAVVSWAPGHALAWSHQVLRWVESSPFGWSLRARALVALERNDLAQAVLWEAVRRLPGEAFVRTQLALLLEEQQRYVEAEALLREAVTLAPLNPGACVELARLLNLDGRREEAEVLIRRGVDELPDNVVLLYTFINLLISWNRLPEASRERDRFVKMFPRDEKVSMLNRLIGAGAESVTKVGNFLAFRAYREEGLAQPVASDGPREKQALQSETESFVSLSGASRATHADLLFRLGKSDEALIELEQILSEEVDSSYANIVWALHDVNRRESLAAQYQGTYGVLAPHLASATPSTSESTWLRLKREFPERQHLTEFTRLIRSGEGGSVAQVSDFLPGQNLTKSDLFSKSRLLSGAETRIDPASVEQQRLLNTLICAEAYILDAGLLKSA